MKIFLDCANLDTIKEFKDNPLVQGYTTNPSLLRKAGVIDYVKFAKELLFLAGDKPVSLEVLADDFGEMERQAKIISSWGNNAFTKIPITNSRGESSIPTIYKLLHEGIPINITAVFTKRQIRDIEVMLDEVEMFRGNTPLIVSLFAGRIADTGRFPVPRIRSAKNVLKERALLLWASSREVINITEAEHVGCDIITCSPELLKKHQECHKKDLNVFSRETVKMFYNDAQASGFTL